MPKFKEIIRNQSDKSWRREVALRRRTALKAAPATQWVESINEYLFACDSVSRGPEMLTILVGRSPVPSSVFWPVVIENWCNCDLINVESYLWLRVLAKYKCDADPMQYMEPETRVHYDSLPEKLTIYRGGDRPFIDGLSWTLNRQVAEGFARGFRLMNNRNPVIATAQVSKRNIFFATSHRDEAEVVAAVKKFDVEERPDLQRPCIHARIRPTP
jgi:hypothetical protein